MKNIDVISLKKLLTSGEEIQLVDVREYWENEIFNIGGINIPLGNLMQQTDEISRETKVIFYCEKGIRSVIALQRLETLPNYANFYNLSGGMYAWKAAENI